MSLESISRKKWKLGNVYLNIDGCICHDSANIILNGKVTETFLLKQELNQKCLLFTCVFEHEIINQK